MNCPKCGAELPTTANFCQNCGEKLAASSQNTLKAKKNRGAMVGSITAKKVKVSVGTEEKSRRAKPLRLAYLNRVLENAYYLSLAGIDPKAASDPNARLLLGAVYTALLTQTAEETLSPQRGARRLSALEQLDLRPRLVLLGDPGSGKSTFVNFVGLCLAGEALKKDDANLRLLTAPLPSEDEDRREKEKPQPQPWRHGALLPVPVILRDFAARGLPPAGEPAGAKHLWDFIAAELEAAALGDFAGTLKDELRKQGGLLLLDGLDEVPEAEQRRTQIKQCVEGFAAAFPKCRILVTSRTYAYQKQDWRLQGFDETLLAPFSRGQIRQFIEHWYAHVADLRHMAPQDAQGRAVLLQRAIFGSQRMFGLAERPLLLTLMASLHAWRGGTLPEKREKLYDEAVDLLLDQWESPKVVRNKQGVPVISQPSLAEYLKVDRQKLRDLLNRLAFDAHGAQPDLEGTADISQGALLSGLMNLNPDLPVNPAQLIAYLSDRAGLLLPHGVGVYTFPHRTFQEYLAACYLTDHDFPEKVAELACQDLNRWREVVLLAGAKAGRGSASAVWALADALCYQEMRDPEGDTPLADWHGALLAGQALVENLDPSAVSPRNRPKLERVQKWLVQFIARSPLPARERAAAGAALAHLGDPRFDPEHFYLPKEPMLGFVRIPAGPFLMGSDKQTDEQADDDEQPQHEVTLAEYYLSRYPVTNAQFDVFARLGGYAEGRYWPEAQAAGYWRNGAFKGRSDAEARQAPYDFGRPFNLPNHPVVGVSWYEALAYCRWLGEKLLAISVQQSAWDGLRPEEQAFWQGLAQGKLAIGLPSEAEWEKAARGPLPSPGMGAGSGRGSPASPEALRSSAGVGPGHGIPPSPLMGEGPGVRVFPWGDVFDPDKANTRETGLNATSPVGCFPNGAGPYGLLDQSGNVLEWTRSLFKEYPYRLEDGRENLQAGSNSSRVLRGGSYFYNQRYARCAGRLGYSPDGRSYDVGFRVGALSHAALDSGASGL